MQIPHFYALAPMVVYSTRPPILPVVNGCGMRGRGTCGTRNTVLTCGAAVLTAAICFSVVAWAFMGRETGSGAGIETQTGTQTGTQSGTQSGTQTGTSTVSKPSTPTPTPTPTPIPPWVHLQKCGKLRAARLMRAAASVAASASASVLVSASASITS